MVYLVYFEILTIVRRPDTREDIKSLPALAVTIVLCAPETAVRDIRKARVKNAKINSLPVFSQEIQ